MTETSIVLYVLLFKEKKQDFNHFKMLKPSTRLDEHTINKIRMAEHFLIKTKIKKDNINHPCISQISNLQVFFFKSTCHS